MTTITGRRTVNTVKVLEVNSNPSLTTGATAPIGSIALTTDGSGLFVKTTSPDTGWVLSSSGSISSSRTFTAGAGLTGGGDLSADRTFNIGANIDGSIIVNADDIKIGILATDAQHGSRGNGTLHSVFDATHAGFVPLSGGGSSNFLRADGSWASPSAGISIGSNVTSGTGGDILFVGSGPVLSQDDLLTWDAVNHRLGVGTASPVVLAQFVSNGNSAGARVRVSNNSAGTSANTVIETVNNVGAGIQIQTRSSTFTDFPNHSVVTANHGSTNAILDIGASGVSPTLNFFTDGLSGQVTRMVITEQDHTVLVSAGTVADTKNAFRVTATFPSSSSTQTASAINVTTGAGTASQYGLILTMNPGFTGSRGNTGALEGDNFVAGTGTWNPLNGGETAVTDNANSGVFGVAGAATPGTNIGFRGQAYKGAISIGSVSGVYLTNNTGSNVFLQDSLNIGSLNFVTAAKNASSTLERHIGVYGAALGGNTNVGGYFGLISTAPIFTSSALVANNGSTVSPIFIAQDDGYATFTIADGGVATTLADIAVNNSAKGIVLKDNAGTPHYWRVTVNSSGTLITTDIGTSPP